ncbi:LysR family transcriptional regulator ArgP [Microbacterium lacticum]
MQLTPDLARTLADVVDEGSLDAAARRLHVTPSAVSQRIKALEEQVGRVLLVRSKPVRPTDAAHAVIRYARQLDLLEHDALAALGAEAALVTVPLAVNADSLATWFLAPLAELAAHHPVLFDLHRDDQDFTAALLESGTVMGAVTSRAEAVAGCRVVPLGTMRYEAVATPAFVARWLSGVAAPTEGAPHAAAPASRATPAFLASLAAAPRVDFDRRDDLQRQWLTRVGVDGDGPRHYVPASHDFASAILQGLGWGLLPGFQSHEALAAVRLVRVGGPPVDVPLSWQQWNLRSELLDAVAEAIVRHGRAVLTA